MANRYASRAGYNVREPELEAYGDRAPIANGGRYDLLGDNNTVGGHQIACVKYTSESVDKPIVQCDTIGSGHPDPDVCFADGRFYLATQQSTDRVRDGPWGEKVAACTGINTDNDGKVDAWSEWTEVQETHAHQQGVAKQFDHTPSAIDLSELPPGFGSAFEFNLIDTTENASTPAIDRVAGQSD